MKMILFVFVLFILHSQLSTVNCFAQSQKSDSVIIEEMYEAYNQGGDTLLDAYINQYINFISNDFIKELANRGMKYRKEHFLMFSLKAAMQKGNDSILAFTYLQNGDFFYYTSDFQNANKYYDLSLEIFLRQNDLSGQGNVYWSKGDIFLYTSDYSNAQIMYDKALIFFEKAKSDLGQGNVYQSKGDIFLRTSDYSNAQIMYDKALIFFEKAKDDLGQGNVYKSKGDIFLLTSDYSNAQIMYDKALIFFEKTKQDIGQGNVYFRKGDIFLRTSDYSNAQIMYDKALKFQRKGGNPINIAISLRGKAKTLNKLNKIAEAKDCWLEAITMFEKARKQAGGSEEKKRLMEDLSFSYYDAAEFFIYNRYDSNAFSVSEKLKARVFTDQLAEKGTDIEKSIPPDMKKKRDSTEGYLNYLNKRLGEGKFTNIDDSISIVKAKYATEKDLERLVLEIRTKYPLYAVVEYPQAVPVETLQKILKDDEVVLEYLIADTNSYCYVITKKDYRIIRLPKPSRFYNESYRKYITNMTEDFRLKARKGYSIILANADVKSGCQDLYQYIFEPVRQYVTGQKLIIIPDGTLATVPFEMLFDSSRSKYLIEDYSIKYYQSATLLHFYRSNSPVKPVNENLIAFGDPVFDYENYSKNQTEIPADFETKGDKETYNFSLNYYLRAKGKLSRLPGSGEEVKTIKDLFVKSNKQAAVYTRIEATEERAKSDSMANYGYMHFSTHGILDSSYQALAFSQIPGQKEDGFLNLGEIMNSTYNARLVVLSACETGLGEYSRGEGVTGMTRAVMYAGTPSVCVSLWSVSDKGTKDFFIMFYTKLLSGQNKDEALRQTKLEMIKSAEYSHPFIWSAFVMYGE